MSRLDQHRSGSAIFSEWLDEGEDPETASRDCAHCGSMYAPPRSGPISGRATKRKRVNTDPAACQRAEAIQQYLDTYKHKLAASLKHDLDHAQGQLDSSVRMLSEDFERGCQNLDTAERTLAGPLVEETVSVARDRMESAQINLGQHFQVFRDVYKQKCQQLRDYWKEYEQVQTEIENFVVSMISHDAFEISAATNETGMARTSTRLEHVYEHVREQYATRKTELQSFTDRALERNKDVRESYTSQERATLTKLRGLMEPGI